MASRRKIRASGDSVCANVHWFFIGPDAFLAFVKVDRKNAEIGTLAVDKHTRGGYQEGIQMALSKVGRRCCKDVSC